MRVTKKILFGTTFFFFIAAGYVMHVTGGQTFTSMMVFSSAEDCSNRGTNSIPYLWASLDGDSNGATNTIPNLWASLDGDINGATNSIPYLWASLDGDSNGATNTIPNLWASLDGDIFATAFGASFSSGTLNLANTRSVSVSIISEDTLDVQPSADTLTVYVSSPTDTITRITTTSADRIESFRNRHDFAQIEESRLSIWDLITYWFRTLTSALPDNDMVRFLVYLIGGAVLLYLISWLVYRSFNRTHFRQNKVVQYGDAGGRFSSASGGANPEDLLRNGDFRNAIRLMLIDSLQNLASEKKIALHKDKTNRDYLYELPEGALREHFSTLSRIYNYVWYGDFEPAQFQVDAAQNAWKQLVSKEVR